MKYILLVLVLSFLHSIQVAAVEEGTEEGSYAISGWKEAMISVRDLDQYRRFFDQFETWELVEQGAVSKAQMTAWRQLPPITAKYHLYANNGTESGLLRLVQFDGAEQVLMRPDSQAWDTGGIFDINMRARDLDELASNLRRLGWQARSPVTQFSFGPFVVKEWITQNSDGLAIAFIQRIAPALDGWPNFKSISRAFNSTQVVKDLPTSLVFYQDILGFKPYLEHYGASKEPGPNVLGLPHNLSNKIARSVYILHPQGLNDGSVELLAFEGAVGRDNSSRAGFPNIGIGALSFPVIGIENFQLYLEGKRVSFVHRLESIGGRRTLTIKSPEGAWLEFYEQVND